MRDLLIPRRLCTCSCHKDLVQHLAPCCKPDDWPESDGVLHSDGYYDFDRNLPIAQTEEPVPCARCSGTGMIGDASGTSTCPDCDDL